MGQIRDGAFETELPAALANRAREWDRRVSQRGHGLIWPSGGGAHPVARQGDYLITHVSWRERAPEGGGGEASTKEPVFAEIVGAMAGAAAVFSAACGAASLFAFGASIGYGFTPLAGIALIFLGLIAAVLGVGLARYAVTKARRPAL